MEEESERFPEVEKIIIETLEDQGGVSDYSTLQDLLPGVPIDQFLLSMCYLTREGTIIEGDIREVKCFVGVGEMLVAGAGIARTVTLAKRTGDG